MKSFLRYGLLMLALAVPFSAQAADTYTLDPTHTSVVWHISHFGFSNPSGKFSMIEGSLVLDEKQPQNSKLTATIPIDSLQTGVAKLDEHLRAKDFFEIEKYPTATFVSEKVTLVGKDKAKVLGTLTLHGESKPVTLDVKLNKIGQNMFKKQTAGFSASTTIKRSDFGMVTYLPGLGDEVTLQIDSEANL